MATSVSVAGNVAHAVLTATGGTVRLAAAAAVVPPASCWARRIRWRCWCGLVGRVHVLVCAGDDDRVGRLCVRVVVRRAAGSGGGVGMSPDRAWLWPVAIDVSIANSTLSLLSLAPPATGADPAIRPGGRRRHTSTKRRHRRRRPTAGRCGYRLGGGADGASARSVDGGPRGDAPRRRARWRRRRQRQSLASVRLLRCPRGHWPPWRRLAGAPGRRSVGAQRGDVQGPGDCGRVLAEHAAGAPPGAISRRHHVHHSTVGGSWPARRNCPADPVD